MKTKYSLFALGLAIVVLCTSSTVTLADRDGVPGRREGGGTRNNATLIHIPFKVHTL